MHKGWPITSHFFSGFNLQIIGLLHFISLIILIECLLTYQEQEDEARLQELQEEHVLMKAQLQQMQALERSLDAAQQAQCTQQQQADMLAMQDTRSGG